MSSKSSLSSFKLGCGNLYHFRSASGSRLLILLSAILIVFYFGQETALASAESAVQQKEASNAANNLEDLLLEWDENGTRQLTEEEKELLPYLIYDDMLDQMRGTKTLDAASKKEIDADTINYRFRGAYDLRSVILTKAALDYQARYGHISRPAIKKDNIPEYEKRADGGDLEAMLELRRYFENPAIGADYNPEQTDARYWLYKAVATDSSAAILEAGYDHPYAVTTELRHDKTDIVLDVYCEGIVSSSIGPKPGCFLYSLSISDVPRQYGHLVINPDPSSGDSLIPQKLALLKTGDQVVVELISYSDSSEDNLRKDYFDLAGKYLGSNSQRYTLRYFWHYKDAALTSPSKVFQVDNGAQVLAEADIRTLPYKEALLFKETQYPRKEYLTALEGVISDYYTEKMRPRPIPDPNVNINRHLYERMSKLFTLDFYKDTVRTRIKECEPRGGNKPNWPPYRQPVWDCYEGNEKRTPYALKFNGLFVYAGLKHDNAVKNGHLYQACKSMGTFPDTVECFALYVRFDFDDTVKRHFVIEQPAVMPPLTSDLKRPYEVNKSILFQGKSKATGKKFIFLASAEDHGGGNYASHTRSREDIFDEHGNYLGSTNPAFSSHMVMNYKPLPGDIGNQLNDLEGLLIDSLLHEAFDHYHSEPDWADIFIQTLRNSSDQKE